jgi:uncharacterized protein YecE (DUF72 family)
MIRIGTSGFSYADWRGRFYPEGMTDRDMLAYYATRFPVVELNFTYYRMPNDRTLGTMVDRTPPGFEFAVKAHQSMTHELGGGPDRKTAFEQFKTALSPFEQAGRLGCVLFQFPWKFRPSADNRAYLGEIRDRYPELPLIVEFRNNEWDRPETYDTLRSRDLGYCCVDEPQIGGLMPRQAVATSNLGYVRFHGRNAAKWYSHKEAWERYDYLYSPEELTEWVPLVQRLQTGTAKTYVLYNNCHAGQAPRNAQMMLDLLGLEG